MNLTGSDPILQIHPTRRCNLRCLHCYSGSSPDAIDTLSERDAVAVVEDAATLGYTILSVSGGEPFLYRPLPALLGAARSVGMRTQVVSNGLAITRPALDAVGDSLGLIAVSLDGAPADHDRMRGSAGAFGRLERRLALIRRSGIPFGMLFTLTMFNVADLAWAAEFAADHGAALLQVHPLEAVGRATALRDEVPDELEATAALVEAGRLQQQYEGRLRIHVDIATVGQLLGIAAPPPTTVSRLADVVSPLVVEPDGACVPFEYGFTRAYGLGDITTRRLADLAPAWLRDVHPQIGDGMSRVQAELESRAEGIVVNSYELLRSALPEHADGQPVTLSL